ncbi:Hypothetical predicted protein [Mytilus galloprovincialis]|uniref:Uncharacterized protein n=1 Tax=Mytilus galloprovincialis TaxID=29158 RepID=A0A8B6FIW8_MYTGA|nr:Hypothetical predicted protein [Mytilus galloprovincialis]
MKEHLVEPKTSVGTVSIKRSFEEDSLDIQDLDLSLEMLFEESKEIQQNTPKEIPESKRPKQRRAARNLEVAEAGKNLTTEGITEVKVNLRSETFKWPVYVAPIEENMLLGCDLIDEMKVARVGEKDTNSWLVIYKEAKRSEFLSTRDSMEEPVMADDREPMVASTQDMCEYIGNISASYEEEDGNQFCQKEKISQLKDSFRNTDLNQTKKELENKKHVTQDTQKDWRKRKKRAVRRIQKEKEQKIHRQTKRDEPIIQ